MFTNPESSNLKLIDFGLARKLNAGEDLKIFFGTPEFVGKTENDKLYFHGLMEVHTNCSLIIQQREKSIRYGLFKCFICDFCLFH